jgi:hypothetical protein
MRRIRAIVLLMAVFGLLASSFGCANPGGGSDGYYRRGSIHRDAFPPGYVPGRHRDYGYGRHGW